MKQDSLISFIESCFRAFERQGVPYCIMRNADEVEKGDAHDVDLAVAEDKLKEAEECLFATAAEQGWKILFRTGSARDKHNIKWYNFYRIAEDGTPVLAHIDIFTSFVWCSHILLDNAETMAGADSTGLYRRISPVVEAVTELFIRLLYNGYVKRKYTAHIVEVFTALPHDVQSCIGRFLSPACTQRIYALAMAEQWEEIEAMRDTIVAEVRRNTRTYRLCYWRYLISKALRPISIVAALQGTDGSGKTTIIDELPAKLGNTWPEEAIRYFHGRPYVLEPSKQEKQGVRRGPCPEPHAQKPYGKLKSFAKLTYCVFDYIIGWCGPIYWARAKGRLIIFDRYYYDFYLDKLRYRFHLSDWVIRMMQTFVPKPDITFVLTGDAETIWVRKKEIPLEEVARQIRLLEHYQPWFANPHSVNVNQPISCVVHEVCAALLETQNKRYQRFLPSRHKGA